MSRVKDSQWPDSRDSRSSRETWTTNDGRFWPEELPDDFRISTFDYNSSCINSNNPSCKDFMGMILSYDAIRMCALRLLTEMQKMRRKVGHSFSPVLIAHGYGGLICEQAYLFSLHMQAPSWDVQTSGLILFGTPHFLAGLAQWALISAKKLGIPCEDTPQQQDWSAEPIQENLKRIAGMQKEFRDLDTEPKMACYFSWLQVPESKLRISPEFAILPGVRPLSLNAHHFEMTKLDTKADQNMAELPELLRGKLPCRASQERLLHRWIESSQEHHGHGPSDVRISKPSLTRDKIFSPEDQIFPPRSNEQKWAGPRRRPIFGAHFLKLSTNNQINQTQINQKAIINDLMGIDCLLKGRVPIEEVFQAATKEEKIDNLKALFILRGNTITINEEHIKLAAKNTSTGADMLEMFFLLRGDQIIITKPKGIVQAANADTAVGPAVKEEPLGPPGDQITTADMKDIVKAAAANTGNGAAVMEILLDRYGGKIITANMEDIIKAAAANTGNGAAVIEILLDRYGGKIITADLEDIVKAAAANTGNGAAIIEILLDRYGGKIITADMEDIIKAAAANTRNGAAVIEVLLDRYRDQVVLTEGVVKAAAANRSRDERVQVSSLLLRVAKDRNESDKTLLRLLLGVENHHTDISWDMLSWAARQRPPDNEICELLLESGHVNEYVGYDSEGYKKNPISYAIWKEDETVVEMLVKAGKVNTEDVEAKLAGGEKALSWAAEKGLLRAVTSLLGVSGIQVDSRDNKGRTALFWAAAEGKEKVVEKLLGTGKVDVNANAKGDHDKTPLLKAAERGHEHVVQLLLGKDEIDVNARDKQGNTALMKAAEGGHENVVQLLLGKDEVDVKAKDEQGKTALMKAAEGGYKNVERLLSRHLQG